MANYYTLFCDTIERLTPAEEAWLRPQIEEDVLLHWPSGRYYELDVVEQEGPPRGEPTDELVRAPRFLAELVAAKLYDWQEEADPGADAEADFEWSVGDNEDGRFLAVYSEESGSVDHAALLLQLFLLRHRPQACLQLTWAATCDRSRPGAFGGGGAFITANKIEWVSAYAFVDEHRRLFEAAQDQTRGQHE